MEEKNIQENIPSVNVEENKIVADTFAIPLVVNNQEIKIKMRKLTAGEKRDLVKTNAAMKVVGTQPTGSIDAVGYQIGLLSKVIVEAPFSTDENSISTLPEEVLDYLFLQYEELTKSKKKD